MIKINRILQGLAGVSAVSLFAASNAFAGGTAAGTNVQNTFTLNYEVGGTAQPEINNTASPTEFTVDRLIDLTVASQGNTTVAPGAQDQTLLFQVTNTGNDTQAYSFALFNETGDQFDTTGLNITYYPDNGDGTCDATDITGAGTAYTPGSNAASADVAADAAICVVVDSDIPAGEADGNQAGIALVADTLGPVAGPDAGTPVIADTGGNTLTGAAENVLADGTGTAHEAANAGDHSAIGTYIVASPDLSATKSVSVYTQDGSACSTIPGTPGAAPQYAVPGACVEYVISTVNNGATASATNIDIQDVLPGDLTFINAQQSGFTGGTFTPPATNTDCTANACTVSLTGATLGAGNTGTITIRALIK